MVIPDYTNVVIKQDKVTKNLLLHVSGPQPNRVKYFTSSYLLCALMA